MFGDQPAQASALVRDPVWRTTKLRNIGGRPVLVTNPNSKSSERSRGESIKIALAFVAIYLVWGSTYLAIRYAVETIPPLVTAGIRHTIAGAEFYWHGRVRVDIVRAASTGSPGSYSARSSSLLATARCIGQNSTSHRGWPHF